jgi:hypothetical protein
VYRSLIDIKVRRETGRHCGQLAFLGHIADRARHTGLAASAGVGMIVPRSIGVRLTNDQHIRWVISASSSVSIGHAALDVAIANYPSERFTLRNRALVIREYKPEVRDEH